MMPVKAVPGKTFARSTKRRLAAPGITTAFPRIVSRAAIRAAASALIPEVLFFSAIPARDLNAVRVIPGQKTVTVTPDPSSSFRIAAENDSKNALQALYTD